MRSLFWRIGAGNAVLALAAIAGLGPSATFSWGGEPEEQQLFVVLSDESDEAQDGDEAEESVEAPKLWLGISLKEVEGDLARYLGETRGVFVDSVYDDSPADKAGIVEGDLLLSANGKELSEPMSLLEVIKSLGEEKALELQLLRKGDKQELTVTLEPRPAMEKLDANIQGIRINLNELGGSAEELKALHDQISGAWGKDVNVFRFGSPSLLLQSGDSAATSNNLEMVISKETDGEVIKVEVTRENEEPAKITVTRGDEEQVYTEDEIGGLPKDVIAIVKPILDGEGQVKMEGRVHVVGPNWKAIELKEDLKEIEGEYLRSKEAIGQAMKELVENRRSVAAAATAQAAEMVAEHKSALAKVAEEAKERAKQAKVVAEEMRSKVREVAKAPAEVESLRALVEELRQEVNALKKKLDEKN